MEDPLWARGVFEGFARGSNTFEALEDLHQVAALLPDLVLARLLAHPEVPQVGQSEASHLSPRVAVGE